MLPFPGSRRELRGGGGGGQHILASRNAGWNYRQSDLSPYSNDGGMDGEFLNVLSLVKVNCATRQ